MYTDEECMSPFTAMTNEKTKLLRIDKKGFELYMKSFLLANQEKLFTFYYNQMFLGETKSSFKRLLPLVAMTQIKKVMANTLVVE